MDFTLRFTCLRESESVPVPGLAWDIACRRRRSRRAASRRAAASSTVITAEYAAALSAGLRLESGEEDMAALAQEEMEVWQPKMEAL